MTGPNVGYATLSIIPSAKGFKSALSGSIRQPLADTGKDAGKSSGKSFLGGMSGILKGGIIAVGATAAAGLTKGFSDALGAGKNNDLIAARLGVSEDDAARLGGVAADVYRSAWGDSLGDTTDVVTALFSSFDGLDDSRLESLTGQAIALGEAFEIDTASGIQTASELMSSGLAGSAEEAFDLLTAGLREMPQGIRDELLAASNEYGDFFADLGYSGEEAFGILTKFADDGVYGIDKAGDALKELTIRGTDMSTASVSAFEAAGLSAEEMSAMFLAGGDQAREATRLTAEGLLGIEDPSARANAAIALFGTPLEDLSTSEIPGFLDQIGRMDSGLGDVSGSAADMADVLSDNASSKIEEFKRKALGALADFAAEELIPRFEDVVDWFKKNWPQIRETGERVWAAYVRYWNSVVKPVFNGIVIAAREVVSWFQSNWPSIQATAQAVFGWFESNVLPIVQRVMGGARLEFDGLVEWVRQNWPELRETIDGVMQAVKVIVETVIKIVRKAWDTWGETLLEFTETRWGEIKDTIEAVIKVVRGIIDTVTALIRGDWEKAWKGIKTFVSGIWDLIKVAIRSAITIIKTSLRLAWDAIGGTVRSAWSGIKTTVSNAIDSVVGFVRNLPSRLLQFAVRLGIAGSRLGLKIVSGMIQNARDGIGSVVGFFRDLPGRLLGWGGSLFSAGVSIGTSFVNGIKSGISSLVGYGTDIANGIIGAFKSAWNGAAGWINDKLPNSIGLGIGPSIDLPDNPLPTFHTGGLVGGPAGSEVLAVLEAGEVVLSRRDVGALMDNRSSRQLVNNTAGAPGRGGFTIQGDIVVGSRDDLPDVYEALDRTMFLARHVA